MASVLYERVRRTLVICRETRLAFPGVFMGITGCQTGSDSATLMLKDDAILRDGRNELDWCALCAAVDAVLGAPSDMKTGPRVRPATAHLDLQMTGAAMRGDIAIDGRFVGFSEGRLVTQSLVSAVIRSGETLIGHTSSASVLRELPEDRARAAWPWLPDGYAMDSPDSVTFDEKERLALEACKLAEVAATEAHPFIEHFWCGIPRADNGNARLSVRVTPHLGNRIGHVQGGILLGMALKVADAAAPEDMRPSNISAYFISPGIGQVLDVRSQLAQRGRSLATVRTQIIGPSGKLVLEATSQHVLK